MTEFSNLAALVAQGQALLDEIKGGKLAQIDASFLQKLVDVDAALAAKIAQANTDIAAATAPINDKIPRIVLSKNIACAISSGTVPDGWVLNSACSVVLVDHIGWKSSVRDAAELVLLGSIENDVKEQFADFLIHSDKNYFSEFNIVRLDWDFGGGFDGSETLFTLPQFIAGTSSSGFGVDTEITAQSFMKLVTGVVGNANISKNHLLGKWRYCNEQYVRDRFGDYESVGLTAYSQTGSVLIALPSVVTGLVSHPENIKM